MGERRKGFWEFFIEDAINNPPFYTTAEVTGVEIDGVIITYTDRHGNLQTKKVNIDNTTEYSKGDLLDIQLCGGHFPSISITQHQSLIKEATE